MTQTRPITIVLVILIICICLNITNAEDYVEGLDADNILDLLNQLEGSDKNNIWQIQSINADGSKLIFVTTYPSEYLGTICEVYHSSYRKIEETGAWIMLYKNQSLALKFDNNSSCRINYVSIDGYTNISNGNIDPTLYKTIMNNLIAYEVELNRYYQFNTPIKEALTSISVDSANIRLMVWPKEHCPIEFKFMYHSNEDISLDIYSGKTQACNY